MPKFIHLTDTHQIPPGQTLYGLDPAERLRAAVASIASEHGDAAFVVVTGDLAHRGEPEAYAVLRDTLASLPMPVHLVLGNHDDRSAFRDVFPDTPVDAEGFVQYAFDAGPLRMICVDTNEPGVHWGVLCERRAAWLAEALAGAARDGRPVHLFMHHPPFRVGLDAMDRISLRDTGPLEAAIGPHRDRIRHLYFGHVHRPIAGSWSGIPFSTVRSPCHQVALVLDRPTDRIPGSHEPPQYGVVLAERDGTVVHVHDFADASPRFEL
ncbi:MAG: 3,5-cyclic adenosine monophosphate phosphodiesterase CpdA [Pseudomonadota bacterium]|jgi:3',5'-cyclic AMP phosphodiesterase CpdA